MLFIAVYKGQRKANIAQLIAFTLEAVSCLLWKKFFLFWENIESVKDGTLTGLLSDRYYCVVLGVYLNLYSCIPINSI